MLKSLIQNAKMPYDFFSGYMEYLADLIRQVDISSIDSIFKAIQEMQKQDGTLYIIGNGGSAAVASHIVNDISFGIRHNKGPYYKTVSIGDNISVITALSNDLSYEDIFVEQLKVYLRKDDLVMAISVSGNSLNIIKAVEYAKNMGVKVISCTGVEGGALKQKSDINFHVPVKRGEYGPAEDLFQILGHAIYSYFRFSEEKKRKKKK